MMEWKRIVVTTSLASNPIACIRNWSILTKNLPRTWLKINWNKASSCYQSRGLSANLIGVVLFEAQREA